MANIEQPNKYDHTYTYTWPEFRAIMDRVQPYNDMDDPEWYGEVTYPHAMKMLDEGYQTEVSLEAVTYTGGSLTETEQWNYDLSGACLDVGAFLAGEPECFITSSPRIVDGYSSRLFKLGINIGGLGLIQSPEFFRRGKGLINLVNSLSISGFSPEITLIRSFRAANGDMNLVKIIVKAAGEPLDAGRAMFVFGHPAFYRRLLFGLGSLLTGDSPGRSHTVDYSKDPTLDLIIPMDEGFSRDEGWWKDRLAGVLAK